MQSSISNPFSNSQRLLGRDYVKLGKVGSSAMRLLPLRASRNSSICRRSHSRGLGAELTVLEENINTKGRFGFNQHFPGGASELSLD